MYFNFAAVAAAVLAFANVANSHLIMKMPVPYGVDSLNNSPLNDAKPGESGSDYPCKQRPGVYDITKMNHITVDTPTEMSFEGSASHGGGTCQIAITKDQEPTANSTFKIIQVFEGGCPVNSDGNGGTHPFSFSIPKDFPNGQMTLAWLWYNRIGNREAYMNCAPITVTGGSDGDDYFNSLPNMYRINLPSSECESTYQSMSNAVTIPHPGQFILRETAGQDMHAATGPGCAAAAAAQLDGVVDYKETVITDNGAAYQAPRGAPAPSAAPSAPSYGGSSAAAGGSSAPSYGGSSANVGGSSAAAGSSAAYGGSSAAAAPSSQAASGMVTISTPASAAPSGAASGSAPASYNPAPSSAAGGSAAPSGGYASVPASSGAPAPSGAAGSAAPSGYASAPASYGAPAPSSGASSSESCSSSGMACSSDGKQFGLCANSLMVWQPVAAGTSCKNGQIMKRSGFRNVHVRRHIQHSQHF